MRVSGRCVQAALLITAVVVAVAMGARFVLGRPSPAEPGVLAEGVDPAFSSGGVLAFTVNTGSEGRLCCRPPRPEGTASVLVTGPGVFYRPVWSPNGEYIAYLVGQDEDPAGYIRCQVYVYDVNAKTSHSTDLVVSHTRYDFQGDLLTWFPDNSRLLVAGPPIAVWDLATKAAICLTPERAAVRPPSLSPDASCIAFIELSDKQLLKVFDLATLSERVIYASGLHSIRDRSVQAPEWLNDSAVFIETDHPDGGQGITLVDLETGSATLVLPSACLPVLSSDCSRLAFIYLGDTLANAVYDIGSGAVDALPGSNGGFPDWSPDGTRLLIWSRLQVRSYETTTFSYRDLSTDDSAGSRPAWHPGGSHVAVSIHVLGGQQSIVVLNADTGP